MSGYKDVINRLRVVKIQGVKRESPSVKTFTFHDKVCGKAKAGQFVMVWIPGVDEIPLSLSTIHPSGRSAITVAEVGEATKALQLKKNRDVIGIRGPYGNGFNLTSGSAMIVGGGTGVLPLVPLAEKLVGNNSKITFLFGAETRDELLFLDKISAILSKVNTKVIATTEDGSYGLKEVVTDPAERILAKKRFDMVYACGPEQMLNKMFLLAEQHNMPLQASLERFMRCAIGLCGSCAIGKFVVCKDGPVFSKEQLREVKGEFGRFKRHQDGRRGII